MNPDPIGLAGGLNLYGYTANRPVNSRDELGLLVKPALGLGVVGDLLVLDVVLLIHNVQEGYKLAQAYGYFLPKHKVPGTQREPRVDPADPYPKDNPFCPAGPKDKWTCLAGGHATPIGHNSNSRLVYAHGFGSTEASAREAALDNVQNLNVTQTVFGGRRGYVRHPHIIKCWRGRP
jgi:hypothetical protein